MVDLSHVVVHLGPGGVDFGLTGLDECVCMSVCLCACVFLRVRVRACMCARARASAPACERARVCVCVRVRVRRRVKSKTNRRVFFSNQDSVRKVAVSFWHNLDEKDKALPRSIAKGSESTKLAEFHRVELLSFQTFTNVPDHVTLIDARVVMPYECFKALYNSGKGKFPVHIAAGKRQQMSHSPVICLIADVIRFLGRPRGRVLPHYRVPRLFGQALPRTALFQKGATAYRSFGLGATAYRTSFTACRVLQTGRYHVPRLFEFVFAEVAFVQGR